MRRMKLYVAPMDAVIVEVRDDGWIRLENEEWTQPSLQERRAIIYAAKDELASLKELLATHRPDVVAADGGTDCQITAGAPQRVDTEPRQECARADARLDGRHGSSLPAASLTAARVEGTIGVLFDALRREEVVVMTNQGTSGR